MVSELMRVSTVVIGLLIAATAQPTGQEPLRLVQRIPLAGVEGRIDHLAVDRDHQRLYVAALGNNTVEVIDLRAGQQIGSLPSAREPQGLAIVPELTRLVVATGEGAQVQIRDATDPHLAVTTTISPADDADNVRYDANARRVYVGYGSGALMAIDPADGRKLGEIGLAGHPESFQLEKTGPRVFVNVPTAKQIACSIVRR
jgi:DNA-binding beta-propeller fold protein YncE